MYDNLLPQKSYLVNGKVKFLVLKSSGELCDSEKMYIFDLKTDSLIQKVERSECYETADRLKKSSDIIFVRTKETTEQFYDNGMIMKTENADSDFTHNENITKIKTTTEKAFKKDQLR
ncbi:hypothetical protein ASG31_11255 [Chryseobacterium sp. Leaf404]|uniref:hypothetical protein n=1 Tax=unclassified Chryseobacterium TaxID=2593645 RepID=UPI0006FF46A8|nr:MULTISPECIES: hypothetical protein [unclassified Chryseobacterium]KQT16938.1 hypothetical protein ASG31_11255 [Chryseobacterium sp. Leaf404]